MDIEEQIEDTKNKILEMGLAGAPPTMIENEEKHLTNLIGLKLNNLDDS